jgi:hypothetical protein
MPGHVGSHLMVPIGLSAGWNYATITAPRHRGTQEGNGAG